MSSFVNTIDEKGDTNVLISIINKSIDEMADNILKTIGEYAFANCSSLREVNFPSVETIGNYAFRTCSNLTSVTSPKLKSIGTYSFASCAKLTSLNAQSIAKVPTAAFYGCTMLEVNNFPSATGIDDNAFQNCKAIGKMSFPLVTSVKSNAFRDSSVTMVDFSKKVSFSDYALHANSLTAVILRGTTMSTTTSSGAFGSSSPVTLGTGYIYVPSSLIDTYKANNYWSKYANQFRALEDYTVDGTITGELDESKI